MFFITVDLDRRLAPVTPKSELCSGLALAFASRRFGVDGKLTRGRRRVNPLGTCGKSMAADGP
jgi:hypothetical protein